MDFTGIAGLIILIAVIYAILMTLLRAAGRCGLAAAALQARSVHE